MREYKKNSVVDVEKLRRHAELLETAIKVHLGESRDVEFLANSEALTRALVNAKMCIIRSPQKLGLGYWQLESNIRDVPDVAHRLAEFSQLLEGWGLADDDI